MSAGRSGGRASAWWTALLVVAVALSARSARADEIEEQARTLFYAGVEAYNNGQFLEAAQAFTQANAIAPRPELDFSTGQAFRRQFAIEPKPEYAVAAGVHLRRYVAAVKTGDKVLDASRALGELAPFLTDGEGAGAIHFPPRIAVQSPAPGSLASIDGGPLAPLPLRREVAPGTHRVEVQAPGYFPTSRQVEVKAGELAAVDVPLEPQPCLLEVAAAEGAEVALDGRPLGQAPLSPAVEVPAGAHFVAITALGHVPHAEMIDFTHGTTTELAPDLVETSQRRAAYGLFATAGAAAVGAGILGAIALSEQARAAAIVERQRTGTIDPGEISQHNGALDRRDALRTAAFVSGGFGAAMALVGVGLFSFDWPEVPRDAVPREPSESVPPPAPPPAVDLLVGAGVLGASARFAP